MRCRQDIVSPGYKGAVFDKNGLLFEYVVWHAGVDEFFHCLLQWIHALNDFTESEGGGRL